MGEVDDTFTGLIVVPAGVALVAWGAWMLMHLLGGWVNDLWSVLCALLAVSVIVTGVTCTFMGYSLTLNEKWKALSTKLCMGALTISFLLLTTLYFAGAMIADDALLGVIAVATFYATTVMILYIIIGGDEDA